MKILAYELDKLGVRFTEYFDASRPVVLRGRAEHPDGVELDVALLDLQTFWDPRSGIVPARCANAQGSAHAGSGSRVVPCTQSSGIPGDG